MGPEDLRPYIGKTIQLWPAPMRASGEGFEYNEWKVGKIDDRAVSLRNPDTELPLSIPWADVQGWRTPGVLGLDALPVVEPHRVRLDPLPASRRRAPSRVGMVLMSLALDPDLHRRLKILALKERASINELIREAVRAWLDARNRGPARKRGR